MQVKMISHAVGYLAIYRKNAVKSSLAQLTAQVIVIPVTLLVWWVLQNPTNLRYSFHWLHLHVLHMHRWQL